MKLAMDSKALYWCTGDKNSNAHGLLSLQKGQRSATEASQVTSCHRFRRTDAEFSGRACRELEL